METGQGWGGEEYAASFQPLFQPLLDPRGNSCVLPKGISLPHIINFHEEETPSVSQGHEGCDSSLGKDTGLGCLAGVKHTFPWGSCDGKGRVIPWPEQIPACKILCPCRKAGTVQGSCRGQSQQRCELMLSLASRRTWQEGAAKCTALQQAPEASSHPKRRQNTPGQVEDTQRN